MSNALISLLKNHFLSAYNKCGLQYVLIGAFCEYPLRMLFNAQLSKMRGANTRQRKVEASCSQGTNDVTSFSQQRCATVEPELGAPNNLKRRKGLVDDITSFVTLQN